jgi:SPP1 gp7 family putative phage head morphogenesis protein
MPSEKLTDTLISHRVGVELFSKGQVSKIHGLLEDVATDVRRQLLENLPTSGRMTPNKRKALERLLKKVDGGITEAHALINDQLFEGLAQIGALESEFSVNFLSAQVAELGIKGGIDLELLDAKTLNQIIESEPLNGRYLKDWFQGLEKGHQIEIRRQVNIGMAEGESHEQIIARLMGKNSGSSTLGLMRGRAEMVVRTSTNHVTNRVHMETLDQNKDIFPKYQWISILDSRTTPICQARHAKVFSTGKGPVPPAHPSCRSTIIGLLKEDDGKDIPEYKDWLERQEPDMQRRVLGPSRYKLFQQGIKPDKFIAKDGTAITLKELAATNKATFERAGLTQYTTAKKAAAPALQSIGPSIEKMQRYTRDGKPDPKGSAVESPFQVVENDRLERKVSGTFSDGVPGNAVFADVDLSKLNTFQINVDPNDLLAFEKAGVRITNISDAPRVAEFKGAYYLFDGNHRAATLRLQGAEKMKAALVRLEPEDLATRFTDGKDKIIKKAFELVDDVADAAKAAAKVTAKTTFKPLSIDKAKEWLKGPDLLSRTALKETNPSAVSGWHKYVNFDYEDINRYMRLGGDPEDYYFTPTLLRQVQDFQKVFTDPKAVLTQDLNVYRGIKDAHKVLPGLTLDNPQKVVGSVVTDKGFLSTTLDPDLSVDRFLGKSKQAAILNFKAPTGARAVKGADHEFEVIFKPGTRYKITGVRHDGQKYIIDADILGEPE